jgi:Ca-activated chloride channel family protein
VQGKLQDIKARKPVHLTFLVDVSGSMSSPDKLPLAKQALKILINNLKDGDTVALVTYAGATKVVLEPTGMAQRGRIIAALDDLTSGGGTGMSSGMELAYKMALTNHKRDHVNRVIILSDGDANIGPSSQEEIQAKIKSYVDEGVTMSTIGLGMGNYKDTTMEQLANKGNGNYYYIDNVAEARKVFGEQIGGTLEVIAKDVKLQVEFNPKAIKRYRLVGYENRDIADQDFRNDKVDAGELGAGHTVTALYEVELVAESKEDTLATVRIRHKKPEGAVASEAAFPMTRKDMKAKLSEAPRDLQFAASVIAFAEILRQSPYAKGLSYDLVLELAQASTSPKEADRTEFVELVRKAKALSKK